jgi:hypothetical protein
VAARSNVCPRPRSADESPTSTGPAASPARVCREPHRLLAQHDGVHVVADYGTRVESELEVFAFITRANDDPRGFSLLAMVVSRFEADYLRAGAGLFESFPGQLSRRGVAARVADAIRRGAPVSGSWDFLVLDCFELAPLTVEEAAARVGLTPKGERALAADRWGCGSRGVSE